MALVEMAVYEAETADGASTAFTLLDINLERTNQPTGSSTDRQRLRVGSSHQGVVGLVCPRCRHCGNECWKDRLQRRATGEVPFLFPLNPKKRGGGVWWNEALRCPRSG